MEKVDKYVYLGSLFTTGGKIDQEIDRRMGPFHERITQIWKSIKRKVHLL